MTHAARPSAPATLRRRASTLFLDLADRRDVAFHSGRLDDGARLNEMMLLASQLAVMGAGVDGPDFARLLEAAIAALESVTSRRRQPRQAEVDRLNDALQALGRRIDAIMAAPAG